MIKKNKAVILMSGGLDSLVALHYVIKERKYNICLALTFDYGQKAFQQELKASQSICDYYKIKQKIIKLDWLKSLTNGNLTNKNSMQDDINQSWVPNRNSLFLNIAACFCDAGGYDFIIYGANSDEAETFSDNTKIFSDDINKLFETSTRVRPKVLAPLINYGKNDIVRIAVNDNAPLQLIYSCYGNGQKHCGKCESCKHLKKALEYNDCQEYIDILFEKK